MNKLHISKFPSHHMIKALQMGSNRTDPNLLREKHFIAELGQDPLALLEGKTVPGTPNPRTCLRAHGSFPT